MPYEKEEGFGLSLPLDKLKPPRTARTGGYASARSSMVSGRASSRVSVRSTRIYLYLKYIIYIHIEIIYVSMYKCL